MTTVVLIMNPQGISLAADSAATSKIKTWKIFDAEKLFMLSRNAPVGIMIYDSGLFMGIPWSIIIKEFQKKIGDKRYDTLKEYLDEFIEFLKSKEYLGELDDQMDGVYKDTIKTDLNNLFIWFFEIVDVIPNLKDDLTNFYAGYWEFLYEYLSSQENKEFFPDGFEDEFKTSLLSNFVMSYI